MFSQIDQYLRFQLDALQKSDYAGWDVFDGLNSRLFKNTPFYKNSLLRLAWIQLFKRSPVNLRGITAVPKGQNPKALALFISAFLNLAKIYPEKLLRARAETVAEKLLSLKSDGYSGLSFGYNFDWQARAFFVPAYKPNMICSVFAAQAFLDLFEVSNDQQWLQLALQVKEFILAHQILMNTDDQLCFSYIPGEKAVVHNINLLGASFLSRLFRLTGDHVLKNLAQSAIRFSINAQDERGAWVYGQRKHHQWVDNFHTGYNLTAIFDYQNNTGDDSFRGAITKGLQFHASNHFLENDLLPKYTDIKVYPLDIHNYSQTIISAVKLASLWPESEQYALKTIQNAFTLMFDPVRNYFYFQKNRYTTNKNNYIRWGQAWMIYALSLYLKHHKYPVTPEHAL
jgi:hypothetical protein